MKTETKKQLRLTLLFAGINFAIMLITVGICVAWLYIFRRTNIAYSHEVMVVLLVFAIRSVIVGTIVALLLMRIPLKPLRDVISAADKIADGDYSVRLEEHGPKIMRELTASFNHMVEELDSVEILRSDFINNFSHEFKTPITSICGYAEIVRDGGITEEERNEYMDIIIGESRRLADLSTNILRLSALEKQSILTGQTRVNVTELLRLSVALLYEKCQEKDISFDFDSDEFYVCGNSGMLKQLWINLLDNAIKYASPNTEIVIDIARQNSELAVSIKNYGTQISPEDRERIFMRFYQCDASHRTKGNGLGLAIAQRIAVLHGGTITADSSDDGGTVFTVTLPCADAE